ncbi:MAG: hypothetical protein WBD20_13660 [Pirellulaceae bacterium]
MVSLITYAIGVTRARRQMAYAETQDLNQVTGDKAPVESGNPYQPPQ